MAEQKKPFASPDDGLTSEQAHDLGRVARVVAGDKGVSLIAAMEHCRKNPDEIAAIGAAFTALAASLKGK